MGGAAPIPITAIWAWADRYSAESWVIDAIHIIDRVQLEEMKDGD